MGKKGTLSNKILRGLGILVLMGLAVALLRAFDFDPFGIIDWIFSWVGTVVSAIADFFGGNQYFKTFTDKPN